MRNDKMVHLQFWLTEDEYKAIEQKLIEYCNKSMCSPSNAVKQLVVNALSEAENIERREKLLYIIPSKPKLIRIKATP